MAFRGYELNLMLRVQDRASSRLRRLSHDIGGVNRAAQLQRSAGRLATQQTRNQLDMTKTLAQREALLAQHGTERLGTQSRLLRLKAQELTLTDRINRMSPGQMVSARGQASLKRLQAVQKDIIRTEELRRIAIRNNNTALADQLLLEQQIKREIEQQAIAQRAAEKAALAQRRARTLTHVGSAALIAGGVGVAASAAAAGSFANFNRLAVGAATQMRGVNEGFEQTVKIAGVVESSLLDLTRQFPAAADEMAQSIYDISSGMTFQIDRTSRLTETQQRYNQSLRILKLANQVAVAGNTDLNTATDVLITTFNNFDPAVQRPIKLLNELFAIVRFGKGTFAEFSPQIGRLAASARAAGQTLGEAGAGLAFLSQRMPLSQATTALTRIFQVIGRPEFTAGFEQLFKVSPFKEGTRQLRDLSDLMFIIEKQGPKLWKGFGKGSVDLQNVIKNITAAGQDLIKGTTGHTGLVSTEFSRKAITDFILGGKEYRKTVQDVIGTQGEFFRSLQAFRNQPGVQWQIAINQFKAFGIVIGQTVLPAILRFFDAINHLLDEFRDLSPRTQKMIGQFAAYGSIFLFVGGAITSVLGGLAILTVSLRTLGTTVGTEQGTGVLGRVSGLRVALSGLAAIGAISIILKTAWSGNATAMDFIQGAMLGAAAGSIFGPEGAIIGGVTVPVIMKWLSDRSKPKEELDYPHQLYEQYKSQGRFNFRWFWEAGPKNFSGFMKEWKADVARGKQIIARGQKDLNNFTFKIPGTNKSVFQNALVVPATTALNQVSNKNKNTTNSMLKNWQGLATQLTGLDLFSGVNQQMANAAVNVQTNLARALALGNTAQQRAAINAQIESDKRQVARLEKIPAAKRTANQAKILIQLYNDITQQRGRLEAMDNAAAAAQTKAANATKKHNAELERHKKAIERANNAYKTAERRVDALKLKFKQLKEQSLDQLRSAFGDIFGGPFMQGPIGQAFTGIASTLAGFGKTFPIPAQFILQDQQIQKSNFEQLTKDLTFLQKRGVDPKTIQNILGQGSAALPFLEGIRQGTPAQQKAFINNLKDRNSVLTAALETPWQKQITASNTQLQAAKLQLKAAQDRLTKTKKDQSESKKPIKGATPTPTRTTQSVVHHHHGDTVTVKADGATPNAVKAALDRHSFDKRNRR